MSVASRIRHNEYFKSAIVIAIIIGVVLGFFFGLALVLGTTVPVRVVESGSMCVPYDGAYDGTFYAVGQNANSTGTAVSATTYDIIATVAIVLIIIAVAVIALRKRQITFVQTSNFFIF